MIVLSKDKKKAVKLRMQAIGAYNDAKLFDTLCELTNKQFRDIDMPNDWQISGRAYAVRNDNIKHGNIMRIEAKASKHNKREICDGYYLSIGIDISKEVARNMGEVIDINSDETTSNGKAISFRVYGTITISHNNSNVAIYTIEDTLGSSNESRIEETIKLIENRVTDIEKQIRRMSNGKQYELKRIYIETAYIRTVSYSRMERQKGKRKHYNRSVYEKILFELKNTCFVYIDKNNRAIERS